MVRPVSKPDDLSFGIKNCSDYKGYPWFVYFLNWNGCSALFAIVEENISFSLLLVLFKTFFDYTRLSSLFKYLKLYS